MAIPLCILSQAEGGTYTDFGSTFEHQEACPLGLTPSLARTCPCKQRREVGLTLAVERRTVNVQVLSCLFPKTWNGDTIRNPHAFAAHLRQRSRRD